MNDIKLIKEVLNSKALFISWYSTVTYNFMLLYLWCNMLLMLSYFTDILFGIELLIFPFTQILLISSGLALTCVILSIVFAFYGVLCWSSTNIMKSITKDKLYALEEAGLDFLADNINFIDLCVSETNFKHLVRDLPEHKIIRRILKRELSIQYCIKYSPYTTVICNNKTTIYIKKSLITNGTLL